MLVFFFLGTAIIGGIISALTEIGTFFSIILGFLVCVGLFALFLWIGSIWKKQIDEERTQALENNTWKFPVDRFRNRYVALVGKIPANIKKESDYQRAVVIAEIILAESNVGKEYYERYTSREALTRCFTEIASKNGTYPTKVNYEPDESELTSLTDSRGYIREKDLIGRDKTIYHFERQIISCRKDIEEYEQKISRVMNGVEATYQLGKQKESSWAVHGGIASGIAGPAAGLATAIDVQNQNAATRQYNQNLLKTTTQAVTPALMNLAGHSADAKKRLENLKKCRTEATYKLVEFLDKKELLARLKPEAIILKKTTSEVELKIILHTIPDLKIYGDIPASVDGSIKVRLKVNGKSVGTTTCTLPFYGIRSQNEGIYCTCKVRETSDDYQIEILPNNLWAIEKPL